MNKITISVVAASLVLVAGCRWVGIRGNGNIKTDERTISAFANIHASGAFTIEWQNGSPALRITTDENLLPYIDNHISGDTLRLRTREQIWPTHGIKVVISSATRVTLDGSVDQLLADMTGASELNARGLQTKTAEISTTGAADAEIAVAETLKVAITGAGKVTYSGNPKTVEKHISGAGSIRHRD